MQQSNKIHFFQRVVDLYNELNIPIEQNCQFTVDNLTDLHKTIPYKSPVFRTNYFSFIFIKNGKGCYTTDDKTFEYNSRTIYFTNPGHTKSFEFWELKEAYLITFSDEFLKTNIHNNIFSEFPFLFSEIVPPQTPTPQEYKEIETLYLQILKENNDNSIYKDKIIGSLLVAILLKIKALFWQDYYPLEDGNRDSTIVKTFKIELEKNFNCIELNHLSPHDYAEILMLNSSYFSQVIKSKTGKTPTEWINEKKISFAKSLLKNSSKPIKEISFTMGFSEPSHFSNFFKKQTGNSPSTYRNKKFTI